MSEQLDWDAYRYVLDDPTLDRAAFETRMLVDVELALAVADAMLQVDTLRAASSIATPSAHAPSSSLVAHQAAEGGWHLTNLAALAATLMMAVGFLNYQFSSKFTRSTPRVAAQHLAESWLAIRQTEIVDQSSNLVDVSTNFEVARDEEPLPETAEFVATEPSADDDWLMDAAREFYAQGEAG